MVPIGEPIGFSVRNQWKLTEKPMVSYEETDGFRVRDGWVPCWRPMEAL